MQKKKKKAKGVSSWLIALRQFFKKVFIALYLKTQMPWYH
jgi:hypothetical protein